MSSKLFLEKLTQMGYPGAENLDNCSIDFVFCNKKLATFLDWICHNIHTENILRSDEITRYDAIEKSGQKILNFQQLKEINALPEDNEDTTLKLLQTEVLKLKWRLDNYDKQIQIQTIQKQKMSSNSDSLSKYIRILEDDVNDAKRRLESSKNTCNYDNITMNEALNTIDKKLEKIFNRLEMFSVSKKGWISVLDLDPFRRYSLSSVEDAIESLRKRFSDKGSDLKELCKRNSKEYRLIRQGLSNNKVRFFKAEICREGTESALTAAQLIVNSMHLSTFRSTPEVLSSKLSDANGSIESLNAEYNSLLAVVSSKVIEEANKSSTLIVSKLYESKLKRLQSSFATCDKVFVYLIGHLSMVKFIFIAIEIEKRYLKYVVDSVGDFEMLIREESRLFNERKKFVTYLKSTFDERKQFTNGNQNVTCDIINILGFDDRKLSNGNKLEIVRQELVKLKEKDSSLCETLQLNFKQEKSFLRKMDRSLCLLREAIWSECATRNALPTVTPREIIVSLDKLEKNFDVIQNSLLETMENYRIKQKVLRSDICLLHKRTLYVYFYTSPDSLRRTVNIIRSAENKPKST